jgi:hypothetical protein
MIPTVNAGDNIAVAFSNNRGPRHDGFMADRWKATVIEQTACPLADKQDIRHLVQARRKA